MFILCTIIISLLFIFFNYIIFFTDINFLMYVVIAILGGLCCEYFILFDKEIRETFKFKKKEQ